MDGDRITRALARLEAAASRIEAASAPLPAGTDHALEEKYARLREEANLALGEIDQLIEALSA